VPNFILVDATSPVTTISLNRTERRNALTCALLEELCAALTDAAAEPKVRVVILKGEGSSFTSGFDLAESLELDSSLKQAELLVKAQLLLAEMDKVCIAVAHGFALAGGGALIAACDYAVASEDAKFGYPVLKLGIVPTPGMPFLRHELKDRDFRDLVLGGELWDAVRSERAGLVNKVVATFELALAEAHRYAGLILASSPVAVAETKRHCNYLERKGLRVELEEALSVFRRVRQGSEAQKGLLAFAEKRTVDWS
jgi:methylglutaconyl-CoA hydratase